MSRKKRARKTETATAHDVKDKSKSKSETGVKLFERRRMYLEVILNTLNDSESEQQNDVDMVGAERRCRGQRKPPRLNTSRTTLKTRRHGCRLDVHVQPHTLGHHLLELPAELAVRPPPNTLLAASSAEITSHCLWTQSSTQLKTYRSISLPLSLSWSFLVVRTGGPKRWSEN